MQTYPHRRKPTLMPVIAFAGLAAIGALPLLTSTHLQAATPRRYAIVTVRPGDSVWGIASAHVREGEEVGEVVDQIVAVNHLAGVNITPGLTILIPR